MTIAHPDKDTLYFDGACGLCTASTRWLARLDWLGRLDVRDFTQHADDELPVARHVALQGIPMHTRTGRVLVGYPALRRALVQTPLGCLPALAMYVPLVSHLGVVIYRAIARRRARSI